MLSNLESQLKELNKIELFQDVLNEIPKVRKDLGYPPLVTPVSQIVGAQAMANVSENCAYKTLSKETINLVTGHYGKLPGRINEELVELAEKEQEIISSRPADYIYDDYKDGKKILKISALRTTSRILVKMKSISYLSFSFLTALRIF